VIDQNMKHVLNVISI